MFDINALLIEVSYASNQMGGSARMTTRQLVSRNEKQCLNIGYSSSFDLLNEPEGSCGIFAEAHRWAYRN